MAIAIFYFIYIGANGIFTPYLPLYYKSLGFSGIQISLISSFTSLMLIFAPVWGFIADRTGRPASMLKVACAGAALSFSFLFGARSFLPVLGIIGLYSVFYTNISPLADTIALCEARRLGTEYSRLRVWGSIGFIVATLAFGEFLKKKGDGPEEAASHSRDALTACMALMVVYTIAAQFLKADNTARDSRRVKISDAYVLATDPSFFFFLVAALIHWAAMQPYYLFYGLRLKELSIGPEYVGRGFSAGVCSEVAMLWFFSSVKARMPLYGLLASSFMVTSLRWFLVAHCVSGPALAAIQIAHGFSFGAFFVGSIAHLERTVPERLRATGRALFAMIVFGGGAIAGNSLAGYMSGIAGYRGAFLAGSALEFLAPLALLVSVRFKRQARVEAPAELQVK